MNAGHFYCSFCNDIVFIRFAGDKFETCPVCRNHSARWVEHVPRRDGKTAVDFERGKALFAAMRKGLCVPSN